MSSRIIGYFDDPSEARRTEQDLISAGFDRSQVSILSGESGAGREPSAWQEFKNWLGLTSEEDRVTYEEASRRGGTIVSVNAPDERSDLAADIISRHDPIDLDRRAEEWRRSGWSGYIPSEQQTATKRPSGSRAQSRDTRRDTERTEAIPVVEEQLRVGKRPIRRGGVRIHKHVSEQPVQEQVNLREEQVHVERKKVDRPVGERDQAFRERTIEAEATSEEAVVQKEARVREEIELSKDVRERTEQVRDTVRREDVDVEPIEGGHARHARAGAFDDDFRRDFEQNYARGGVPFEHYRPAYEFGADLGRDERFRNREWRELEPEARQAFETRNPNTWDRYGPAVRTGFIRARKR